MVWDGSLLLHLAILIVQCSPPLLDIDGLEVPHEGLSRPVCPLNTVRLKQPLDLAIESSPLGHCQASFLVEGLLLIDEDPPPRPDPSAVDSML